VSAKNSGTAISGNFTPSINCRSVSTKASTFRKGILDRPVGVADGVQRQPGPSTARPFLVRASAELLHNRVHSRGSSRRQQITHLADFVGVEHFATM
jgi:hypothetical protein